MIPGLEDRLELPELGPQLLGLDAQAELLPLSALSPPGDPAMLRGPAALPLNCGSAAHPALSVVYEFLTYVHHCTVQS